MKNITLAIMTILFLASCASQSTVKTEENNQEKLELLKSSPSTWNEAPIEMFSNFGQFEINQIKLTSTLQSDEKKKVSSEQAAKLISDRVNLLFNKWQQNTSGDRTLVVDATFSKYQIVSGGARFWAGAFAGDSEAQLDVTITEKATGNTIAKPLFYQSANALAAAWTFGSHDSSIPERLAILVEKYMTDNFNALEGGPTGRDK